MNAAIRSLGARDVHALARLHRITFAGALGASVGERYLRANFDWYATHPHAIGIVAEDVGQVVGYVFGAPLNLDRERARRLLPWLVMGILTHPRVLLHPNFRTQLPARLKGMLQSRATAENGHNADAASDDATFALVGIGVAPTSRGRGVADGLIEEFERQVRRRGYIRLVLDVYADNRAACHLYERHGWRVARDEGRVLVYEKAHTA